ncbi:putative pentatricopeptide repeat-containing protein At3g15130 [Salvia hispanica]|uniref:putative pentatricopeptide repeat-containing protein At3g15130 n=1 Tax=Salvia hispanica TaxID=49212 RepID=UPI0020091C89|nr:putative pentatricopeptide repeat-containing protein At3g15130 [Salvia hispanica]
MLLSHLRKFHTASSSTTTYATILRHCVETSNLSKAKSIHAKLIKASDHQPDSIFIHNHLINAYIKCGDTANALQLFDEMPERNVVSWTALIAGFAQKGFPSQTLSLFSAMHRSSVRPNEFTFVSVLQACSFSEIFCLISAFQVFAMVIKFGFENNVYLVNALLTTLIRHGEFDEAVRLFEACLDTDVVSWNALFDGFLKFGCDSIPSFWRRMLFEGVKPDAFTFATVLTGLAELSALETGLQVHSLLVKSGHGRERCVGNALVDMYLKSGRLNQGFLAFDEIPSKDVCSWTQIATGCLNCGDPTEALRVIGSMRRAGVRPNKFTLATGINACASLSSLDEGLKLQALVAKLGDEVDVCVENALLDLYAKGGQMDGAVRVFVSMRERTVVSWTTMIMGFAQNGEAEEALNVFEEMRAEGERPNHITLVSLLYACSQGGFIERGLTYFSSMTEEFGIVPSEDHYVCVVNLLGRVGRIREAEELILRIPFEPSAVVWQTLLGACRLHGDVETARRAAKGALAADRDDPSTYVLMSNTFADFEDWGSAKTLREWLEIRDIKKMPGTSWVEIGETD